MNTFCDTKYYFLLWIEKMFMPNFFLETKDCKWIVCIYIVIPLGRLFIGWEFDHELNWDHNYYETPKSIFQNIIMKQTLHTPTMKKSRLKKNLQLVLREKYPWIWDNVLVSRDIKNLR